MNLSRIRSVTFMVLMSVFCGCATTGRDTLAKQKLEKLQGFGEPWDNFALGHVVFHKGRRLRTGQWLHYHIAPPDAAEKPLPPGLVQIDGQDCLLANSVTYNLGRKEGRTVSLLAGEVHAIGNLHDGVIDGVLVIYEGDKISSLTIREQGKILHDYGILRKGLNDKSYAAIGRALCEYYRRLRRREKEALALRSAEFRKAAEGLRTSDGSEMAVPRTRSIKKVVRDEEREE